MWFLWIAKLLMPHPQCRAESAPSNADGCTPSAAGTIEITGLTTDKTTHCSDASEPASNLEVFTDVPPDSVEWAATAGVLMPSDDTASWLPTAGMDPVKVTVTCTVHQGADQDTDTLSLYVTQANIVTNGEMFRTHFVHGFLVHIQGIDWDKKPLWGSGTIATPCRFPQ